jgi:microcystin-dependent protein
MSRTINPNIQYEKNGKPIVGGKVYYGVANQDPKTNLITIFSDSNLTVPITNPQLLDGQGRLSGAVYVGVNQYSFQVDDNLDNQQLSDPQLEPMNIVGLVTASIDLNGFKIVNAGDATANSEYATFGQNNELYPQILDTDASSTADSLVANMPVPMDSLGRKRIILRIGAALSANLTLTPTFKLNSFSAFTITRDNNDSLLVGDTGGGRYYLDLTFSPDDNRWHLSNPFQAKNKNLEDMEQGTIKGKPNASGTGSPIDLSVSQTRDIVFPTGGFINMWSGTVASIPAQWSICDGSNGTPDLRDRFILSVGITEDPGGEGGEADGSVLVTSANGGGAITGSVTVNDHTLTTSEIPAHTHSILTVTESGFSGPDELVRATNNNAGPNEVTQSTGGGAGHNHTASFSGASLGTHTHDSSNNFPLFFKLAFIMFTG